MPFNNYSQPNPDLENNDLALLVAEMRLEQCSGGVAYLFWLYFDGTRVHKCISKAASFSLIGTVSNSDRFENQTAWNGFKSLGNLFWSAEKCFSMKKSLNKPLPTLFWCYIGLKWLKMPKNGIFCHIFAILRPFNTIKLLGIAWLDFFFTEKHFSADQKRFPSDLNPF